MAEYVKIRNISRQNLRIANKLVKRDVTSTVNLDDPKTRRDLASHAAIGQFIVVGDAPGAGTASTVWRGGEVTNGAALNVNVAAGEIRKDDGTYVAGAAATNFALTVAHGTLNRIDLIHWDETSGAVGKTDGTAAATPSPPATPAGKVPLAEVQVDATSTAPDGIVDKRPRF